MMNEIVNEQNKVLPNAYATADPKPVVEYHKEEESFDNRPEIKNIEVKENSRSAIHALESYQVIRPRRSSSRQSSVSRQG